MVLCPLLAKSLVPAIFFAAIHNKCLVNGTAQIVSAVAGSERKFKSSSLHMIGRQSLWSQERKSVFTIFTCSCNTEKKNILT